MGDAILRNGTVDREGHRDPLAPAQPVVGKFGTPARRKRLSTKKMPRPLEKLRTGRGLELESVSSTGETVWPRAVRGHDKLT